MNQLAGAKRSEPNLKFLRGRDIVCFSHDWTGDPLSKTHLMRLVAKHNRVLWVNSIGYRTPSINASDMGRAFKKLKAAATKNRLVEVEENIHVLHPIAVPKYGSKFFRRVNRILLGWQVRNAMRSLNFQRPINWIFNPAAGLLARQLSEDVLIYQCVDEYTQFTGVDAEGIRAIEAELLAGADLVVVSAQRLYDAKRHANNNTHLIRHGVDVEHFQTALSSEVESAPEVAELPGPVIGFFGLISDWVDVDLIAGIADRFPDGSIVLVGKVTMDVSQLESKPNVHLLGQKRYEDLPKYCKSWDVAIIPFKLNELTLNFNPLKTREYLAAGLPVVSTAMPEVEVMGQCLIANDVGGFVAQINKALENPGISQSRSDSVSNETWVSKLEEIDHLLENAHGALGRTS